jgi:hypothetical protein
MATSHVELIRHFLNNSSENWKKRDQPLLRPGPSRLTVNTSTLNLRNTASSWLRATRSQIYRGARQRSKNRRASRQSRTDISVYCHHDGRGRRDRTADESSEYSSRKHAVTAKSSGEQSTSNLNCNKQRPELQHSCQRDGRRKLQRFLGRSFDYAITPHPQSRNQSHRQKRRQGRTKRLGRKESGKNKVPCEHGDRCQ